MSKKKKQDSLFSNRLLDKTAKSIFNTAWARIYINEVETMYSVNKEGEILSHYTDKVIKPYQLLNGYMDVQLHVDKKIYHRLLHRLVALAYVDNPDPVTKTKVNHKDGVKTNNKWWNLEWVTNQENMDHAVETGLIDNTGMNNPNNKYSEDQIHQACMLLEDGMGPTEISKIIQVDRDTVGKIKSREIWKQISCDYNIPWPSPRVYTVRPADMRDKVITLLNNGETDYGKILLQLGLPDIRRNRKYVTNINISRKSKVNSSTTRPNTMDVEKNSSDSKEVVPPKLN